MLKKNFQKILFFIFVIISLQVYDAQAQRFPKPEFESGHTQPVLEIPESRSDFMEYLDVFILFLALSLVSWLVIKKRSRKGVLWVSIFSILYFGFLREGCVCSVGAIQNVALALFNPNYKIPLTVIAFFVLPLIYALIFGRVFCAGVCPLGAIQDFFVLRPIQIPLWLQKLLGLIPYIYLGLAVLYATTGTDFIICRYDPFIGIFRMTAQFSMIVLGVVFLLTSVFVARPYCRFFCPYSVLLNLFSRVSKYHLTITPSKCVQCRLCENSCPFGAIEQPEQLKMNESRKQTVKRFVVLGTIIPLLVFVGGWTVSQFHETLAKVHPKVLLAQELVSLDTISQSDTITEIDSNYVESIEIEAFKTSGESYTELYADANEIIKQFYIGAWILGAYIGLVFALTLASLSTFRYRKNYEPNKGTCLSCARCMDYCPIEPET